MEPLIRIEGFTKTYGRHTILFRTMYIRKRIVLITGANGSGKTTFLKCLSGCIQTDTGFVNDSLMYAINGPDLPKGLKVKTYLELLVGFEQTLSRFQALKRHFNLEPLLKKPIRALSTGMAQRVALVSSLMHGEGPMLLDEPMQGLDTLYKKRLVEWMRKTHRLYVVATHEKASYDALDCEVYHFESPD